MSLSAPRSHDREYLGAATSTEEDDALADTPRCSCEPGFYGPSCAVPCSSEHCQNGFCHADAAGTKYQCHCFHGFEFKDDGTDVGTCVARSGGSFGAAVAFMVIFLLLSGFFYHKWRKAADLPLNPCADITGGMSRRAPAPGDGYLGGGTGNALPDPVGGYKPPEQDIASV